jgi:hypothetical protein
MQVSTTRREGRHPYLEIPERPTRVHCFLLQSQSLAPG